jgi:hypothetical protein
MYEALLPPSNIPRTDTERPPTTTVQEKVSKNVPEVVLLDVFVVSSLDLDFFAGLALEEPLLFFFPDDVFLTAL